MKDDKGPQKRKMMGTRGHTHSMGDGGLERMHGMAGIMFLQGMYHSKMLILPREWIELVEKPGTDQMKMDTHNKCPSKRLSPVALERRPVQYEHEPHQ